MDFFQYMPLNAAINLIMDRLAGILVDSETVHLTGALGRIAAGDIMAKESLPMFSRSSVDGFALRSLDTFGVSESAPSLFSIEGEVAMGQRAAMEIIPGQAVTIPTGGMLPTGSDAVVMFEYTEQLDENTLLVHKTATPGENVIGAGEDIKYGEVFVRLGQRISSQHIGALAALGHTNVLVRKQVEVTIVSTGDELVDIDEQLELGQVRDVNSYTLSAMLTEIGCLVKRTGIVKDNYGTFLTTLSDALKSSQLVIISGGSSVGTRDFTVKAIDGLGTPGVLIHGIAIKPGKPTIFGLVDNVPIFGLPGHPVAAMIVCDQLVKPVVRKLMCESRDLPANIVFARLIRNVPSAPGRDDFVNVKLIKQDEIYFAEPILGKSGLISTIARADGILHVPADKSGFYDGDIVEVLRI